MTTPNRSPSAVDGEASTTMIFPVTKADDQRTTNRIGRRFLNGIKIVLSEKRKASFYNLLVMVKRQASKKQWSHHAGFT